MPDDYEAAGLWGFFSIRKIFPSFSVSVILLCVHLVNIVFLPPVLRRHGSSQWRRRRRLHSYQTGHCEENSREGEPINLNFYIWSLWKTTWILFSLCTCLPLASYFSLPLFLGQTPPPGHHAHCSGEAELHPVPPDGAVPGPSQQERREGHEAEVQPQLQQELQTPLHTGPEAQETLQPPFLR